MVLDPPTFSQSKENGTFRAEKDYGKLVTAALPLLKPGGDFIRLDERGGVAAGKFSRGRGRGGSRARNGKFCNGITSRNRRIFPSAAPNRRI